MSFDGAGGHSGSDDRNQFRTAAPPPESAKEEPDLTRKTIAKKPASKKIASKKIAAPRAPKELPASALIRNPHGVADWALFVKE